ncbi:choline/ethanolamine kinase-like protein 3 [Leptotrombidium deliense]|uniref:Choline/ethanolamine kinase-like protein 3 n=1 Tax=Leptotrombidium deliense TaxID=299467 RepID=A0A443SI92_9ACAR|nr:choline/ethanolamine kinase-like protein 3 [Leptotrombidium deliense]
MEKLESQQSVEMKDRAYQICREFLSGSWKQISSSDMVFQAVSGGLSNILFLCSLPSTHTPLNGEPTQVLLRMYGQMHSTGDDQTQITVTESVIFMLLSERNLGPKLYGVFPGGRLEEYISARALACSELRDPDLSSVIARKLANVHSLSVPINKEPIWMFETMNNWLQTVRKISLDSVKPDKRQLAASLIRFNFESEIEWLKRFLKNAKSPAVFCHNDLQEGNILLTECQKPSNKAKSNELVLKELNDRIVLIDFEYCAYNYRGFDIANHFCEWALDYSNTEYPHFYAKFENFPNEEEQRRFVRSYIKNMNFDVDDDTNDLNSEDHIMMEANYFILATHLLWTLWSINNAYSSQIVFGYWVCLHFFSNTFSNVVFKAKLNN